MRTIDANALIENYLNHCRTEFEIKNSCMVDENVIAIIQDAPTVKSPQGEWILINERLPDCMDDILITFQKPNREPLVYRAVFIGSKFALDNGDTWNWNDPEIKAWMPLPEAYKEAENE